MNLSLRRRLLLFLLLLLLLLLSGSGQRRVFLTIGLRVALVVHILVNSSGRRFTRGALSRSTPRRRRSRGSQRSAGQQKSTCDNSGETHAGGSREGRGGQ